MAKELKPLRRGSEVELAVRRAGYSDFELSQSVALLATPGNITVFKRDREPVVDAMIPFISTVMIGPRGDVSFGTATFGMSGGAVAECMQIAEVWLTRAKTEADELPISRIVGSRVVREAVYSGARNGYACTIGGTALLRKPDRDLEQITFVTRHLLDYLEGINTSMTGRFGLMTARGIARARGKNSVSNTNAQTEQAASLLLAASTIAVPSHDGEPVIVDQPFFATI